MSTQTLQHPDGHRLAYKSLPGGHCHVVFLSGFHSTMEGQKALALSDFCASSGWAFTRFDYRGHGVSEGKFEEGNISAWLSDALTVIRDQVDEALPLILVGSSMGGWLALLATLQLGQRVSALMTLAAAPDFTEEQLSAALPTEAKALLAKGLTYYWPNCYDGEPDYPITPQLLSDGKQHCLLNAPIALSLPTCLIHGDQDRDIPWQQSLRVMQQIQSQQATLHLIKGGDHRLSSPEHLGFITQRLRELVDSVVR